LKSLLLGLLLLPSLAFSQAGSIRVDKFGGLDDTDSAATIPDAEAQDALNVESNLDGTSIKKRNGYALEASLTYSTSAVTGVTHFTCDSGDRVTVVCHDRVCSKSVNGASFSQFFTTATSGVQRWSFVSVDGDLYGANDRHDPVFKYDCTNLTNPSGIPAGSLLELTQDRLAVADVTAFPNRVYYSKSGVYTNFTAGVNSEDSYTDDVGAPGDKITSLKFNTALYIFKSNSITRCILGDQYTSRCDLISNSVGTSEALSVVSNPEGIAFRGTDKAFWMLNDAGLNQISKKIKNLTASQVSGIGRSNIQTDRTDWEAGVQAPTGTWRTDVNIGSIVNSSWSFVDTSSTDFTAGSLVNTSTQNVGSVRLAIGTNTIIGGDFDSPSTWSCYTGSNDLSCDNSIADGALTAGGLFNAACPDVHGTCTPGSGNCGHCAHVCASGQTSTCGTAAVTVFVSSTQGKDQTSAASVTYFASASQKTHQINLASLSISTAMAVTFRLGSSGSHQQIYQTTVTGNGFFLTWNEELQCNNCNSCSTSGASFCANITWSHVTVTSYSATGQFVSHTFDTHVSTPIFNGLAVSQSSNSIGALTFKEQTSADGNTWDTAVAITPGNRPVSQKRYWRYEGDFTTYSGTITARLDQVGELLASTTAEFRTQCIEPGPNISSWGILSCAQTLAGNGSLVYYTTSAATCATLPTTKPSTWSGPSVLTSNNATIAISTGAAMYVAFRSLLGSATDQAQVDACTVYWNEGGNSQPVWGVYSGLQNSLFWSTTLSPSSTANRVLKYDMNLSEWYPWDLTATALDYIDGFLYFGSSTGGQWFKQGVVNSDNGTAINAYWKSKDFSGGAPFQEKTWQKSSVVTRNQQTGTLTATYALSDGSAYPYSVSLSTTSTIPYVRSNYYLGITSPQNFMSIKFGNNSSVPFEVLGAQLDFQAQPWRVVNP
jgi:hypothetical protein